jgi:hypothetical protein
MGARGRRALTVAAAAALLLMAGCTAGPRQAPSAPAVVTTAPSLPAASPPPGPAPPARSPDRVLGVVWRGDPATATASLGWLDARSLRERPGRRLPLGQHGVGWAVAPDQSLALFASGGDSNDGRLLLVDPRRLRRLGTIRLPPQWWDWPHASSWLGRSRVLLAGSGFTERPDGETLNATVVTAVDPLARRVVAQRTLPGELVASGRLPDGLVLLLGPPKGIAPARLAVVDARGQVRTVALPAIAAGWQEPADWNAADASTRRVQPGLAVDPDGRRAFVVAAGTRVAEVDLDGLGTAWHPLESRPGLLGRLAGWLLPAAEAKSVHGTVRMAAWLGDGLLAVWGHDESKPVPQGARIEQWLRPAGLRLVDTRAWRATTIHPDAGGAVLAGGRLLAFGRLLGPPADPDSDRPIHRTYGLTVFGPGDRRPVHLFGARQVNWLQVNGGRAYVDLTPSTERSNGPDPQATGRVVGVVDLRTARVLAEWRGRLPELLVGGCCDEPAGW